VDIAEALTPQQLQIARLCNLQINLRTVNHRHRKSGAFDY